MKSCALGLLAVALIGPALASAPAAAAGARPPASVHSGAAAPTAAEGISWRPCRSWVLRQVGAECANVAVPLDHDKPNGQRISIAVSRVRHTASQRDYQGPMLINPGGPGASGLAMAANGYSFPQKLAAAYDWIGFDPRGVGRSEPSISCDPGYFRFNRPDYYPVPRTNKTAWLKRSRQYAAKCRKNGEILRNMRTEDVARDLEVIRVALGAEKINFYGFSYGTYLGQVYATLFPDRLRRAVFDSNVNPRRAFYRANLDQDVSFENVLQKWFAWIAKYESVFRLGASAEEVRQRFTATQARLATKPAGGKIGPSEWIDVFSNAAYATSLWPDLAARFSRFERDGRARPLIREFKTGTDFGDDNSFAVYNAVQCTDAPWPRRWSTWQRDNRRTYQSAPLVTWQNAWYNAPCLYWPAPPGPRLSVSGKKAGSILLIGGTEDAATPYQGSVLVRRLFPGSRLVAIRGEAGHAVSLDGNPCVANVRDAYLLTGRLPPRRRGNGPDVSCRPAPLPGAYGLLRSGRAYPG